jgi:hypothetical protein
MVGPFSSSSSSALMSASSRRVRARASECHDGASETNDGQPRRIRRKKTRRSS